MGKPKFPGAAALAAAMKERDLSQTALAEKLGVSQPAVAQWLTGNAPKAHHRAALRILFGISEDAWMTRAERRLVSKLETAATPAPAEPDDATADTEPAPSDVGPVDDARCAQGACGSLSTGRSRAPRA